MADQPGADRHGREARWDLDWLRMTTRRDHLEEPDRHRQTERSHESIFGRMKAVPDSRIPRRLTSVLMVRMSRHSGRMCGCSAGTIEIDVPTPAAMPTDVENVIDHPAKR